MTIERTRSVSGAVTEAIGAYSRGKYAFDRSPPLAPRLMQPPMTAEVKYPHTITPGNTKSGYGISVPDLMPAIPPKMTEKSTIDAKGRKIAQKPLRNVWR